MRTHPDIGLITARRQSLPQICGNFVHAAFVYVFKGHNFRPVEMRHCTSESCQVNSNEIFFFVPTHEVTNQEKIC